MADIDATGTWATTYARKGSKGDKSTRKVRIRFDGNHFFLSFEEPGRGEPNGKKRGVGAVISLPKEVVGRMVMAAMAKDPQAVLSDWRDDDEDDEAT